MATTFHTKSFSMFKPIFSIGLLITFLMWSCANMQSMNKQSWPENNHSRVDSFKITLPKYVLNNNHLQNELDSLIYIATNCTELTNNQIPYPVFIIISPTRKAESILFSIKASKNFTSNFIIPNSDNVSVNNDPGFGAFEYKSYFIKLEGTPDLYKIKKGVDVEYMVTPTNNTIRIYGYGLRDNKNNDWILENYGWVSNYYKTINGNLMRMASDKCISGLNVFTK